MKNKPEENSAGDFLVNIDIKIKEDVLHTKQLDAIISKLVKYSSCIANRNIPSSAELKNVAKKIYDCGVYEFKTKVVLPKGNITYGFENKNGDISSFSNYDLSSDKCN
jgi:hypothetical protein